MLLILLSWEQQPNVFEYLKCLLAWFRTTFLASAIQIDCTWIYGLTTNNQPFIYFFPCTKVVYCCGCRIFDGTNETKDYTAMEKNGWRYSAIERQNIEIILEKSANRLLPSLFRLMSVVNRFRYFASDVSYLSLFRIALDYRLYVKETTNRTNEIKYNSVWSNHWIPFQQILFL